MLTALTNFVHAAHAADLAARAGERERKRVAAEAAQRAAKFPRQRAHSHSDAMSLRPRMERQITVPANAEIGANGTRLRPTLANSVHRRSRSGFSSALLENTDGLNPSQILGLSAEQVGVQLQPGPVPSRMTPSTEIPSVEWSGRAFLRWYLFGDLRIPRPSSALIWTHIPRPHRVCSNHCYSYCTPC